MLKSNCRVLHTYQCTVGTLSLAVLAVLYWFCGTEPATVGFYELVSDDNYTQKVWCQKLKPKIYK
jgi:hypothetical protein